MGSERTMRWHYLATLVLATERVRVSALVAMVSVITAIGTQLPQGAVVSLMSDVREQALDTTDV
jgi:hypothetical protein